MLLFFLLFHSHSLIGIETPQIGQTQFYITKDNIAICDEGIVVLGIESLIIVDSLFHNEHGFYFLASGARWKCNWCGELNPLDRSTCQACGQSYGSSPPKKR